MLVEELAHAPRELDLGSADEALLAERAVNLVGDRSRLTQALELRRLLDRAQSLDEAGGRLGRDAAVAQRVERGDAERVGLDSDRLAREPRRQVADHRPRGLLEANPFDRARPLRVAEVGEERRLAVRLDEHSGVRAREPGQVAHIDAARDEQWHLEERGQPLDPTHAASFARSTSSASASR